MPWDSDNCCSWDFWLPIFVWILHHCSRLFIVISRFCLRCFGDRRTTQSPIFNGQVRVNFQTDQRFAKPLEQFMWDVKIRLCCKESLFEFDPPGLLPKREHTVTVVVVPSATRIGIDVDHAVEEIKSNHAWNTDTMPLVVLVLHNQAPHLHDVRPSKNQLTDQKYARLAAILDLQIYGGRMRNCGFNSNMATELANLLLRQHTELSGSRSVEEEEHSLINPHIMEI